MSGILVAVIGVIGILIGALLQFLFNRRTEKHKLAAEYRLRQIKGLYGPLSSLINQSHILHDIFVKMVITDPDGTEHRERLFGTDGKPHPEKLEGRNKEIWDFFADRYFIPINSQMRHIIQSNCDLLNSVGVPDSFQAFFKHEAQFKARRRMEKRDLGVSNLQVEDNPWEEGFNKEVENTLLKLKKEVEKIAGIRFRL